MSYFHVKSEIETYKLEAAEDGDELERQISVRSRRGKGKIFTCQEVVLELRSNGHWLMCGWPKGHNVKRN